MFSILWVKRLIFNEIFDMDFKQISKLSLDNIKDKTIFYPDESQHWIINNFNLIDFRYSRDEGRKRCAHHIQPAEAQAFAEQRRADVGPQALRSFLACIVKKRISYVSFVYYYFYYYFCRTCKVFQYKYSDTRSVFEIY